ncbi:uncharacterized protein LOC123315096 [Coccinella septempunctata]|uniref:uncharacterized protein LOC123315096 n=1 Tax=Coccinella septempunctata TaxID=41139 RepID=UPI001D07474E|nr:uncharacterized protein LOC123315096 [Coccinella septempunctata]
MYFDDFECCNPLGSKAGDDLGLNSILGFNESFQASFFCRFCKTPNEMTKIQTVEDLYSLRTQINYEMDMKSKSFGIKEECVFNCLPSYHVIDNCSVDLMHDMLEGILRYDMAQVLYYLVDKGYFSLDNLNERIRFLNFSEVDIGNPIPPIKIKNIKK